MKIPTEEELVDPNDVEAAYVCGWFLGKSVDDAYEMLRSDSDGSGRDFFPGGFEAFTHLSVSGIGYYLPAFVRYVESSDSVGKGEFVRAILSSLSTHLYREPIRRLWSPQIPGNPLRPEIVNSIRKLAEYVRANLEKFGLRDSDVATTMHEIDAIPRQ